MAESSQRAGQRATAQAGGPATLPRRELPHSLAAVLKDQFDPAEGKTTSSSWAPPAWPIEMATLNEGRAILAASLKPATAPKGQPHPVRVMMAELLLCTKPPGTEALDASQAQAFQLAQAATYEKHLGHVPADLLELASSRHINSGKGGTFFPTPAELLSHIASDLETRQRHLKRIDSIIARGGKPPAQAAPPPVPLTAQEQLDLRKARLTQTRDKWLELGRQDRAAPSEKELAKLEGRAPAEWALPSMPEVAPAELEPTTKRSAYQARQIAATKAALEEFRAAQTSSSSAEVAPTLQGHNPTAAYVDEHHDMSPPLGDEPPLPDEIPEHL
jgi:hypothetical protein